MRTFVFHSIFASCATWDGRQSLRREALAHPPKFEILRLTLRCFLCVCTC